VTGPAIASGGVAAALFLLTALFTAWDVVGRWLFHAPTAWALELTTYAFMMGAFLGGPYAMYRGEHVLIEMLVNALPALPRRLLHMTVLLVVMALFTYLTWYAFKFSFSSYTLDLRSPILHLPIWPVQATVPVAFTLILFEAARQFVIAFRAPAQSLPDPDESASLESQAEGAHQRKGG